MLWKSSGLCLVEKTCNGIKKFYEKFASTEANLKFASTEANFSLFFYHTPRYPLHHLHECSCLFVEISAVVSNGCVLWVLGTTNISTSTFESLTTRWTIIYNATTILRTKRLNLYCCFCCCCFLLILFLRSRQCWRAVHLRHDAWTLLLLLRFFQQCLNLIKNISDWIWCNWEVHTPSTSTTLTFHLLCALT